MSDSSAPEAFDGDAERLKHGLDSALPDVSVIVPVYNDPNNLRESLKALQGQTRSNIEIIVIDDASPDGATADVAREMGATLVTMKTNSGPGRARNFGAKQAKGTYLFFVDADVVVESDAVERLISRFEASDDIAAIFGSYDSTPRAANLVSQFRNLLHHYVHQNGAALASTFWAGCGAIRREIFESVGGYDTEKFPRPSIEDIELGYRIIERGWKIYLDKNLQAKHLKRWTFTSALKTDLRDRAIPWSRLIIESKSAPNDLNVDLGQRLSVASLFLAIAAIPLWLLNPAWILVSAALCLFVAVLNRRLYQAMARIRGLKFALSCIPLHFSHLIVGGIGFGYALLEALFTRAKSDSDGIQQRG